MKTILGIILSFVLVAGVALAGSSMFLPDRSAPLTVLSTAVTVTTSGTTVIAAVPGKKIKVFSTKLVSSGTGSIYWREGTLTPLEGSYPVTANAYMAESTDLPGFLFSVSTGTSLDLVTYGSITVTGRVSYWVDDSF
jgi:hypothetical protein